MLDRFMDILAQIQLTCKFQFSTKYGYYTSLPFNLRQVRFTIYLDDGQDIKWGESETNKRQKEFNCRISRESVQKYLTITAMTSKSDDLFPLTE